MLKNSVYRRAVQEKRALEARRKQDVQEDILKSLHNDNLLQASLASNLRVENMRRLRELDVANHEKQIYENLIDEELERKQIEDEIRKEEEIVLEMQRIHNEQIREQKMRQYIHENSVELRELEKKLNYAYTNKERALQLKEKSLSQEAEKLEQQTVIEAMKIQQVKLEQLELEKQRKNMERAAQYNDALNNQLQELEDRKKQEYETFLKEKALVDEVVQKIIEEDEREARIRLEKQQETKRFIEDFMKEREEWKQQERNLQEEENRKIEEYARLQRERDEKLLGEKKTLEAGKNAIYDKLAAQRSEIERAKMELEELRIDLAQEEQEEAERRKEQEAMRQRVRKRLELIQAYQQQVEYKTQRLEKERQEEQVYREQLMKKFAEDDRLEQLSHQKRRMKQIEHKRAVDALVEERRKMSLKKKEQEEQERIKEQELERYKQMVIEQERQRLLREHATRLVGFLPKGVLRDAKDLELFDEEFKAKFGEK